jgi:hypothetical protein
MSSEILDMWIGARFGEWTIIGERDRGIHNPRVLCRCSCGAEHRILVVQLRSRRTTRCRECCRKRRLVQLPVGTRIGTWTTIAPCSNLRVAARCDCGNVEIKRAALRHSWGCAKCAPTRRTAQFAGMSKADIGRLVGISRERVRQLLERGNTAEEILAGTYKRKTRRPRTAPRCAHCERRLSQRHARGCPTRRAEAA